MAAVGVILLALGVLVAYEALKGGVASAASPTAANAAPTGGPSVNLSGGSVPGNWLTGLAKSESPSLLQGDLSSGAYGLSCGMTPGYPCTGPLPSGDPRGGFFNGTIYPSIQAANAAFENWVTSNHPEAWKYALQNDCLGFFTTINGGFGGVSYGGTPDWPSIVCSGA